MANKVSKLAVKLQTGTDSTYVATWDFSYTTKSSSSSSSSGVKVGSYVTIKSGAKWYNGTSIPSWVMKDSWKVIEVRGNRAVLGANKSGSNNIQSPIDVKYLNGGSSSSSSTTTTSTNLVDHYTVVWAYDSGDGIWFKSDSSDTKEKYHTYSAPSNALRVKVSVKPVAKTRKVNGKDTAYFTGTTASYMYSVSSNPPEVPPTPSVSIEKYELTATVDNISDSRSSEIQFQIYDLTKLFKTGTATVSACMASFKCNVNAGGSYRVRARAANVIGGKRTYGDWTDFTNAVDTIPSAPSEITTIRGSSSTSIYLEWSEVNSAETYEIEYTNKIKYFDNSSETTSVTGIEFNHYEITGLETGEEYFFRVRAVNSQGESTWTEIKSVVIGKDPSAPTTWSSSTTVITGEPLILYWVHNAEDGSTETYAEVEITIGTDVQTYTVKNELADDEENEDKDKTKSYSVDTSEYVEGTVLKWRVRTAGITKTYGDWSIQRSVNIYAPPTLELSVTNQNGDPVEVLESFPFFIEGLAGPKTQMPIGYHVTVIANDGYETVDEVGRTKTVNQGDSVYSRYIDANDPLLVELSASNIDLENNISYTVTVVASMNSGLTVTESETFEVAWTDEEYNLDAEIAIDTNTYVAYVSPYCIDDEENLVDGVTLSVYRREFDGTFTEIATGINNVKNTVVTDPHPALDLARYRIVAITDSTGAVSFYDPPGYPVEGKSVIIQWDEEWSDFDVADDTGEREHPPWSGSMLKLPYNIDVSDSNSPDSVLVEYIGRSYPVSYYGTQLGSKSTWNVAIDKKDQETLYALRRLQIWMGDVYVREPSGSGYWANIKVSFNQKHVELIIPVTLDITRVAGGA